MVGVQAIRPIIFERSSRQSGLARVLSRAQGIVLVSLGCICFRILGRRDLVIFNREVNMNGAKLCRFPSQDNPIPR